MSKFFGFLMGSLVVLLAAGCGAKKEVASEVAEQAEDSTAAIGGAQWLDTTNYFTYFINDTIADQGSTHWSVEEVNGVFAASILTVKQRTFQLTEIPRNHLYSGDTTLSEGYAVYVDPTSLPVKVGLKSGPIWYNYRMFEKQNKVWIQGELIHTTEHAKKVFKFQLYENYPESEQIEELDEQFIDEE